MGKGKHTQNSKQTHRLENLFLRVLKALLAFLALSLGKLLVLERAQLLHQRDHLQMKHETSVSITRSFKRHLFLGAVQNDGT